MTEYVRQYTGDNIVLQLLQHCSVCYPWFEWTFQQSCVKAMYLYVYSKRLSVLQRMNCYTTLECTVLCMDISGTMIRRGPTSCLIEPLSFNVGAPIVVAYLLVRLINYSVYVHMEVITSLRVVTICDKYGSSQLIKILVDECVSGSTNCASMKTKILNLTAVQCIQECVHVNTGTESARASEQRVNLCLHVVHSTDNTTKAMLIRKCHLAC